MTYVSWLTVAMAGLNVVALTTLLLRRDLLRERIGRVSFMLAALALPALTVFASTNVTIDRSKSDEFCGSCHEMDHYSESLTIDDDELIPAVHAQNNLVPRGKACYACHTDYTMFGGVKAKMGGLKHVYVHYLGTVPEKIELYQPFNFKNCLYCHEGARSFEENRFHKRKDVVAKVQSGEMTCLDSNCHSLMHTLPDEDDEDDEGGE